MAWITFKLITWLVIDILIFQNTVNEAALIVNMPIKISLSAPLQLSACYVTKTELCDFS